MNSEFSITDIVNEVIEEHKSEVVPTSVINETDPVAGTPETDVEGWHMQEGTSSCAVVCQEFVAEQLLDMEFSEEQFAEFAEKKGWYDPETGTTMSDVGNILEALGLEVERESGCSLTDLYEDLESGGKVICAVNNLALENSDIADIPGVTANHAVEVIGIDCSDPENVQVILNDSGVENGNGRVVSATDFMKAWETSGCYAVTAWNEATATEQNATEV